MDDGFGEWLLYVVGSGTIQSELLAVFLEKETGLPCRIDSGNNGLLPVNVVPHRQIIVFSDCQGRSSEFIISQFKDKKFHSSDDFFIVLFNVSSRLNIEEELLRMGIWGVFYEEDPSASLPRGVEAIMNGEIWFSRHKMSTCLINMRRREGGGRQERYLLSSREREVLAMIADGLSNNAISDKLCISIHTVRSHSYRIFKKIGVSNRQQASIWAINHL